MNFTVTAQGNGCNVKEKRASLQLDDKKVFSAVVEIAKDEFVLNKVGSNLICFSMEVQFMEEIGPNCSKIFN